MISGIWWGVCVCVCVCVCGRVGGGGGWGGQMDVKMLDHVENISSFPSLAFIVELKENRN